MKKRQILSILGIVFVFVFIFSSCQKVCTCKHWVQGVEEETYTVPLARGEKNCSEKNTVVVVGDKKTGIECK
jgi:hypothetical protein